MSEGLECSICFTEYEFKDLFFVDACGHMFCNGCMEENVKAKLANGETAVRCPASKCPYDLGYYEIKHLLRNDKDTNDKYERFLYEHTIDELDDVVWCPVQHCSSAVPIHPESSKAKCINCNFKFCTKCREELHENTCEWNKKWKGKIDTFDAWKEAYGDKLKVCPGCENLCEKISGCSTVPCVKCKTIFCWLCCEKLGTNSNHFNVPKGCKNTYKPDEKKPTQPVDEEEESSDDSIIEDLPKAQSAIPPVPVPDDELPDLEADDEPPALVTPIPPLGSYYAPTYHSRTADSSYSDEETAEDPSKLKYPWLTTDEPTSDDATDTAEIKMPYIPSFFQMPFRRFAYVNEPEPYQPSGINNGGRLDRSYPVKANTFSNDDYMNDEEFEEAIKKMTIDPPSSTTSDKSE